jgi:hypothetical protein
MKKKILITMAIALMIAMPLGSVFAYEALIGFTGVLQWDQSKTGDGYILLSPAGETTAYLIDYEGYIRHTWETDSRPGLHDRLLDNGNLLRGFRPTVENDGVTPVGSGVSIGGAAGGVQEFDWDGNLVWQYVNKTDTSVQHHTFFRKPGPDQHTFVLLWEKKECTEAIAQGRDPLLCDVDQGFWPDAIVEVDHPAFPGEPNVVWEWHVWDHMIQNFDAGLPNYGQPIDNQDRLDINWHAPNIPWGYKDWNHGNTVEYNEATSQLIMNSRNWGEFYVIDYPSGDIVFRWGNPCCWGGGECPSFNDVGDQETFGPHCVTFLDNGNYLSFDNGWVKPAGNRSRVVEVDPTIQMTSSTGATYYGDIVWEYASRDPNGFYTTFQGGTGRLPNGNTFVTSTDGGHLFEIATTWDGEDYTNEVVWEFIIPPKDDDGNPLCVIRDRVPSTIHRAHKIEKDHPGLVGKDLRRKGHIGGTCMQPWTAWETGAGVAPVVPTGWGTGSKVGAGGGGGGAAAGTGGGGY